MLGVFSVMRIAMLGWEFPPFISGGLGVHCYELTQAMARAGHTVDFYMPVSGKPLSSPHPAIRLIEVAPSALRPYLHYSKKGRLKTYGDDLLKAVDAYNETAAALLAQAHAKSPYDVVHAHDWLAARAGVWSSKTTGLPLVQTFHSTEWDRTSSPWECILDIERQAAANPDAVIAVSKRTADMVRRLGAEGERVHVVYNAVDREKYVPPSTKPTLSAALSGRKVVLFLGRLTEQKGPVPFLHAAKKVVEKDPNVLFFIAGTGELMPLLINLSIELGLQNHVRFLGFLPDAEQKRIYQSCDLYVMPSTSEPFGITALEALASGVPVIVSRTSGVSEVVKSALRVDFWDIKGMAAKMMAVLSYSPLSRAMVAAAPTDLEKLTWEQTAQATLAVYEEAARRRSAGLPATAAGRR